MIGISFEMRPLRRMVTTTVCTGSMFTALICDRPVAWRGQKAAQGKYIGLPRVEVQCFVAFK
jgi:hypothetical protein